MTCQIVAAYMSLPARRMENVPLKVTERSFFLNLIQNFHAACKGSPSDSGLKNRSGADCTRVTRGNEFDFWDEEVVQSPVELIESSDVSSELVSDCTSSSYTLAQLRLSALCLLVMPLTLEYDNESGLEGESCIMLSGMSLTSMSPQGLNGL